MRIVNFLNRKTRKIYYQFPDMMECTSSITKIGKDYIELDATIAYPEGGGQESDQGEIALEDGRKMSFSFVRKMYGSRVDIPGMPDIEVDGVIEHVIDAQDLILLDILNVGMKVRVRIDSARRTQLSNSHTASHLLYVAIRSIRPDVIERILGCHIKTDGARFDFGTNQRFSEHEIDAIQRLVNELVGRGSPITVYSHAYHEDARYWECEGNVIPCGGTHAVSTNTIPRIHIRRKNLGKGKERVSCTYNANQRTEQIS